MYFSVRQNRLLQRVREMVHCGDLTERGLARATGVSQPHVHNMLKGVRAFSPEFADLLLHHLGMTLEDLACEPNETPSHAGFHAFQPVPVLRGPIGARSFPFTLERHESVYPFPRSQIAGLIDPAVLIILADRAMAPKIQDRDLVLLQRAEQDRFNPRPRALYVVETPAGTAVRYLRVGERGLYLLTETSMREPMKWDYLSLTGRNILEVVRGRIVWIGRAMEEDPAQQAFKAS